MFGDGDDYDDFDDFDVTLTGCVNCLRRVALASPRSASPRTSSSSPTTSPC